MYPRQLALAITDCLNLSIVGLKPDVGGCMYTQSRLRRQQRAPTPDWHGVGHLKTHPDGCLKNNRHRYSRGGAPPSCSLWLPQVAVLVVGPCIPCPWVLRLLPYLGHHRLSPGLFLRRSLTLRPPRVPVLMRTVHEGCYRFDSHLAVQRDSSPPLVRWCQTLVRTRPRSMSVVCSILPCRNLRHLIP